MELLLAMIIGFSLGFFIIGPLFYDH
jgi:hypothetical protein